MNSELHTGAAIALSFAEEMEAPLQRLQDGSKPTTLLRELIASNGGIRNFDLSAIFLEEIWNECNTNNRIAQYESIQTHDLIQPIWHWQDSRERQGGHPDEEIDKIVIRVLMEAGLLDPTVQNSPSSEQDVHGNTH